jgi:hypothetical protein
LPALSNVNQELASQIAAVSIQNVAVIVYQKDLFRHCAPFDSLSLLNAPSRWAGVR